MLLNERDDLYVDTIDAGNIDDLEDSAVIFRDRPSFQQLRTRVRDLCAGFPDEYWREKDLHREYPQEFVDAMTEDGLLAALIPEEYGGLGLGISEASIIMEEINRSGGHAAACHAQLYTMKAVLNHGSQWQKDVYLPGIADGSIRLQAFSITEEISGSNTSAIQTRAIRDGDDWVITGHKNWTSRVDESDLLLVLTRTSDFDPEDRNGGLTLFLVDLREVRAEQPEAFRPQKVRTMFNYATNEVTYDGMRVPSSAVVGQVGRGFRYVIDGWNMERVLLAAEAIGDGYWFIDRAGSYASTREVFGRKIGVNQGVQFPIVDAYMKVRAADAVRWEACALADNDAPVGAEANMAKHLASEASWEAANVCLNTYGGYGFVDQYDVERKFRETRMYQVAPVNNNLIKAFIGSKVLNLPRTY
ncbi:Acyl-CoA dehydrogenase fadE12 [Corynebacterium occultum]|uniref:Acyl-CoA dehydrogenase fadE12 n=1 Tax=Corynebacterium occultum TaxID=2675219 RepID=A0A6B8W439_9CORY|nr:acyl-CoA dehydrogenase family protein [Corynebacterium occultum]QGU06175.1 Acyl-CoA dehydrogenase fadE12 [Corynebacterium occultum]